MADDNAETGDGIDDYPARSVPDIPMWSENYAFMIADPAQGVAIASQIGRWPVDAHIWREFFMIGLPDERIVYHKAFGRAATETLASASMFRIEVLEPDTAYRLVFDGPAAEDNRADLLERGVVVRPLTPLSFDLEMRGVAPSWDMSGHAGSAHDLAGRMHIEQVGSVSGTIRYGDETFTLDGAFGQRDHSRGPRIITQLHRQCWTQGWFPSEDVTFNLYAMQIHGGAEAMANASVSRGGVRYPATVKSVSFMNGPRDHAQRYSLAVDSELGPMEFHLKEVVTSMPCSFMSPYDKNPGSTPGFHAASSNEESVIWEWNGVEGVGWSERSFNASPFPV